MPTDTHPPEDAHCENVKSCCGDVLANSLLPRLIGDKVFDIPPPDLSGMDFEFPDGAFEVDFPETKALTNEDLTTRVVNGEGIFDAIMQSVSAHLLKEYENKRITGDQYSKAYVGAMEAAMANGVQYLLGRDQASWQAIILKNQALTMQINAIKAKAELETAKVQIYLARLQALGAEADYGLKKIQIAVADQNICHIKAQTEQIRFTIDEMMPIQMETLLEELEATRAQTMETRKDGTPILGSIGVSKDLQRQQIVSFKRDSEAKAAKFWIDAWITQKTTDEGLNPPGEFVNAKVNEVLEKLKLLNGLTYP